MTRRPSGLSLRPHTPTLQSASDWQAVEKGAFSNNNPQFFPEIRTAFRRKTAFSTACWCSFVSLRGQDVGARCSATSVRYALTAGTTPASAPRAIMPGGAQAMTGFHASGSSTTPVCERMTAAAPAMIPP